METPVVAGGPARRRALALGLIVAVAAWVGVGCGGDGSVTTTTRPVTLTTLAGTDAAEMGARVLEIAGATDSVATDRAAATRVTELAEAWCTTALRSDVANADATFRYSLNAFVTDHGVISADGELQDLPLARSRLAAELAGPLARASNELLCPEVERQDP